jgi:phospholipase C
MRYSLRFALFFAVACYSLSAYATDRALDCNRTTGSLTDLTRPPGTNDLRNPIQHIVVIMQENHSFDNYFGALNTPAFYGSEVDGVSSSHSNRNHDGSITPQFKDRDLCTDDPKHDWNSAHMDWNQGAMDGFVTVNDYSDQGGRRHLGGRVMGYYDSSDIPFYYALANDFAIADKYFSSVQGPTFPNRFYLYAATSFGHITNDMPGTDHSFSQKTIFDLLDEYGVSWKYYSDGEGYLKLFQPLYLRDYGKLQSLASYRADLEHDTLPQVVFLETNFNDQGEDEHPGADVQMGQSWVSEQILPFLNSKAWKSSVAFLTYDENGGFYDHVSSPAACAPDDIAPMLGQHDVRAEFTHLGFRVPFTAISPFAKHHYVSHHVYDHSSILKFIETKFNLPALTRRDANADGLADLFDFAHPIFETPSLPAASIDTSRACDAGVALKVPSDPVKIVSVENGLCVSFPMSNSTTGQFLSYAPCNGSPEQLFTLSADGHGTFQLKNPASNLCVEIDWKKNQLVTKSCGNKEDQGLEISYGSDNISYQLGGWHGDFCVHDGASTSPVAFSTCRVTSENPEASIDFYFE